jgi:hypothetical protein
LRRVPVCLPYILTPRAACRCQLARVYEPSHLERMSTPWPSALARPVGCTRST